MGSLLFLYFLHPITTRLANKTQRFNPRYELTNPTKTPSSPFAFSLLSVILRHLHYTLQSPSTLFPIPFSLCYYPRPHVTLSFHPLLLSPCSFVTLSSLTLSLLSSSSVTIPCSFVTLSSHTLSPLSSSSVTIPRSFVTLSSSYPVPPSLSCKECLPVLSTGAFTLSKARPFKHAEHAFLAP